MPEGKKRPRSLRSLGLASLLIPVRTTSHYKLIARTYDRMVITVMVLSRQAESLMLWVGPDHHTSRYKSILHLIMKSSSLYEPIYTIVAAPGSINSKRITVKPAREGFVSMCACTEPVRTGTGAVCVEYRRPKWPITMLNHTQSHKNPW